jgi:hypothetical protein
MKQKLNELKDFLIVVLLFVFRVLVRWSEALLDEAHTVVYALDVVVNNELVKEEAVVKADQTSTPPASTPPAA